MAGAGGPRAATHAEAAFEPESWHVQQASTVGGHGGFFRDEGAPVVFKPAQKGPRGDREARALMAIASAQRLGLPHALDIFPQVLGAARIDGNRVTGFADPFDKEGSAATPLDGDAVQESAAARTPCKARRNLIARMGRDGGAAATPACESEVRALLMPDAEVASWRGWGTLGSPLPSPLSDWAPCGSAGRGGGALFFAMRDICAGMRRPCVADVKIGSQMWAPGSLPTKVLADEQKCGMQRATGFRITAMQVWRTRSTGKDASEWHCSRYGRGFCFALTPATALQALRLFFASRAQPVPRKRAGSEPGPASPSVVRQALPAACPRSTSIGRAEATSSHGLHADIRRGKVPEAEAVGRQPALGAPLRRGAAAGLALQAALCADWCARASPWHLYGSSILLAYDADPATLDGPASDSAQGRSPPPSKASPAAKLIDFAHAREADAAWSTAWSGAVQGARNLAAALAAIANGQANLPSEPLGDDAAVFVRPALPDPDSKPGSELKAALDTLENAASET